MNEQAYLKSNKESIGEKSFMKKLLKKRLNQKGLTLIELLAVIVILAIIAAIAIPAIAGIITNSRDKAVLADASSIISAAKLADAAGSCDLNAADGDADECDEGTMGDYVGDIQDLENADGTTTAATFEVRRVNYGTTAAPRNELTLVYSAFPNLSDNTEFDIPVTGGDATAANSITEAALNEYLD